MMRPRLTLLLTLGTSGALLSKVRDSAGITIVENQAPGPASRLAWQMSANPTLSIGTVDGDADYQLFGVRVHIRVRQRATNVVPSPGH